MKTKLLIAGILIMLSITCYSQTQYQVIGDSNHPETKILKGIITKDLIKKRTERIYGNVGGKGKCLEQHSSIGRKASE